MLVYWDIGYVTILPNFPNSICLCLKIGHIEGKFDFFVFQTDHFIGLIFVGRKINDELGMDINYFEQVNFNLTLFSMGF